MRVFVAGSVVLALFLVATVAADLLRAVTPTAETSNGTVTRPLDFPLLAFESNVDATAAQKARSDLEGAFAQAASEYSSTNAWSRGLSIASRAFSLGTLLVSFALAWTTARAGLTSRDVEGGAAPEHLSKAAFLKLRKFSLACAAILALFTAVSERCSARAAEHAATGLKIRLAIEHAETRLAVVVNTAGLEAIAKELARDVEAI